MNAPMEIIDFLESIVGIFFYDINQKERSVFILVDNLVEGSCKARLREREKQFARNLELKEILSLAGVGGELKRRLLGRRKDRNSMQHDLVAITVTREHCADSIIDLCKLIKKLWGKYAFDASEEWLINALRIIKLYSRIGSKNKRKSLEVYLEKYKWNSIVENDDITFQSALEKIGEEMISPTGIPYGRIIPKDNEILISIGLASHWTLLLKRFPNSVKICLDNMLIDEI
jgi:hypothetical protein